MQQFIGSATVKIKMVNEKTIKVEIYNVTSFASGNLMKDIPLAKWFSGTSISTVRNGNSFVSSSYSNISQNFSFTLSTSEANKLISKFNPTGSK